jgi:hypothetical protein
MLKLIIAIALAACTESPVTTPKDAPVADAPAVSCAATVAGPTPVGGGNPSCNMTVTITVSCPAGQSGHVFSIYGEASITTLYAASLDAGYQCGVPVVATRDGFDCSKTVAADVAYWPPSADPSSMPITCPVN